MPRLAPVVYNLLIDDFTECLPLNLLQLKQYLPVSMYFNDTTTIPYQIF